jgi:hypothetical protein
MAFFDALPKYRDKEERWKLKTTKV